MEGTRTLYFFAFSISLGGIEIREPRGGDENFIWLLFVNTQYCIEIREPRGGDENNLCNVFSWIYIMYIEIREPRGGDENLSVFL